MDTDEFRKRCDEIEIALDKELDELLIMAAEDGGTDERRYEFFTRLPQLGSKIDALCATLANEI